MSVVLSALPQVSTFLQCADRCLDLSAPKIMGVLNLTPDSFYPNSRYTAIDLALHRVEEMIAEGVAIIDIGAESSRPHATPVSLQEEMDRIMATLTAIKLRFDIILSVDTYKPVVMREAIRLGVHMINDIYALQQEGAMEVVAQSQVALCLLHMQGTPNTMQTNPVYENVIAEVGNFLVQRAQCCMAAGIPQDRIVLDPGFGFGKTTTHNMQLLKNLAVLQKTGFPLLVGLSRKASIGEILSLPVEERLFGSLAAHVIAVTQGACIVRAHDIKPTAEAFKIVAAVLTQDTFAWQ